VKAKTMKTIIINIVWVISIFQIGGCCEVAKLETTYLEKQVNDKKQKADAIRWISGLCENVVTLSWKTFFSEDTEGYKYYYVDEPTEQQWQNIEAFSLFMAISETYANGYCRR
jgi:hypothetical protein